MMLRVAVAADENYVLPLAASVRSILENTRDAEGIEIAVLSCGISPESQRKLLASWERENSSVRWLEIDQSRFQVLPATKAITHVSAATYARLLLPSVLPLTWGRVIYIDSDTITLGRLEEIWESPLKGFAVAAVQDPYTPFVSGEDGVQGWRRLRMDAHTPYFNAGMMVIDLERWREEEISEKCFA